MNISRVWAKNIHGYLSFDIKLRNGLNILVGINGSGKTSALNIIEMLSVPDYAAIATTEFLEIGIELKPKEAKKKIAIIAKKTDEEINIFTVVDTKKSAPINIKLHHSQRQISQSRAAREKLYEEYSNLRPDPQERETWALLETIEKALTISLDRRITINKGLAKSTEDDGNDSNALRLKRQMRSGDAMAQVTSIARNQHSKQKSDLLTLNEKLKSRIISSTFSQTSAPPRIPTQQKIKELETKLKQQMETWSAGTKDVDSISIYFRRFNKFFDALGTNNPKNLNSMLSNLLSDDMRRISLLSEAFEEFDKESNKCTGAIRSYLETLNSFFIDSKKQIIFDEATSQLQFKTIDDNLAEGGVDMLSSGEKQLLILLTLVAFPPNSASTFIIDEPEISLHPKWQNHLIPSITGLMDPTSQMIVATHSPELVGPFKEQCIVF